MSPTNIPASLYNTLDLRQAPAECDTAPVNSDAFVAVVAAAFDDGHDDDDDDDDDYDADCDVEQCSLKLTVPAEFAVAHADAEQSCPDAACAVAPAAVDR